jgi:hypothetical protein
LSQKADLVLAGGWADAVRGTGAILPSREFQVISVDAEGRLAVCRDGHVDAGEQCDVGENHDTECCTASCRLKVPDGSACNDGNACTVGDTCAQGVCQPGGPLPCEPCGVCQPTLGCRTERPVECRTPTASEKSTVMLVDVARSRSDALAWTWRSGQATTKSDFGDPVNGAPSYALCTYGDDPNVPLAIRTIPDNATCPSGNSCWSSTKKGWRYRSRTATPDGISSVVLRPGPAGRASIVVHGRGDALRLPGLPLAAPVTMVLVKGDGSGACWQATHDLVRTNRTHRYVATNR